MSTDQNGKHYCQDYLDPDVPGCLGEADERYTMSFEDIGEGCIYWCSFCGPRAFVMEKVLDEGFKQPGFAEALRVAVDQAEAEARAERS